MKNQKDEVITGNTQHLKILYQDELFPHSILHELKGKVDVTETAGHAGVGFEPAMGQLATPDDIITGVERQT